MKEKKQKNMEFSLKTFQLLVLVGLLFHTVYSFILLWNRMDFLTNFLFSIIIILGYLIYFIYKNKRLWRNDLRLLYNRNFRLRLKLIKIGPKFSWKRVGIIAAKIILGIILFLASYAISSFYFTFLHEVSHALTSIFFGVPLLAFRLLPDGRGYITYPSDIDIPSLIESNIKISGSLGLIIILLLLLIVLTSYRKKLKLFEFVSLYFILSKRIIDELYHNWYNSLFKEFGDGWDFLQLNPAITNNNFLAFFLYIMIIGVFLLSLIFVFDLYDRFKRLPSSS